MAPGQSPAAVAGAQSLLLLPRDGRDVRTGPLLLFHRMVNETDIVELELKSKRFSLSLKKKAALQEPVVQVGVLGLRGDCGPYSALGSAHSTTHAEWLHHMLNGGPVMAACPAGTLA